ncbi:hypothetical protein AAG570_010592 [Ranatra chinensis]|uniref:Uncharacterized protein n=1 Tax=Ranatra chinensis TaxID=642074 RepID=A0ABD0YN95_9HEMI
MGKSKTGLIATGIEVVTFLLVIIAFSTPHWLESDYTQQNVKFEKLGLWTVCFHNFTEIHFWYDTPFNACWWIFEEEYYIISNFLLPGFFVAVQFFFTLCFTLHIIGLLSAAVYMGCSRENSRFVKFLLFFGSLLISAALSGTIAVYLFGLYGDGRDWMPDWDHNNIGWSYALAVIGVIGSYAAGILYLIESRRHHIKKSRERIINATYQMEERAHTNI